jgi:hypothetical protein
MVESAEKPLFKLTWLRQRGRRRGLPTQDTIKAVPGVKNAGQLIFSIGGVRSCHYSV